MDENKENAGDFQEIKPENTNTPEEQFNTDSELSRESPIKDGSSQGSHASSSSKASSASFDDPESLFLSEDSKVLCGVCHLGNALSVFTFLTGFISLVIYLVMKDKGDKTLLFHAKQSFILFLSLIVISAILFIIGFLFSFITFGIGSCLFVPLAMLYGLAVFIYLVYVTVIVFMGKNYRIPVVADWADKINI